MTDEHTNNSENLNKQLTESKRKCEEVNSKYQSDLHEKLASINSDFDISNSKKERDILKLKNEHEKNISIKV